MKELQLPKNKPIAASGAMGLAGRGWWFLQRWIFESRLTRMAKTVTLEPNRGNSFWKAYRPMLGRKSGVNALALGNLGLQWLIDEVIPMINVPTIISIHASSVAEMRKMVRMLNQILPLYPMVIAVEINLSCPNVSEVMDLLGILEEASHLLVPVIAKIGYQDKYLLVAIEAAIRGYIQGITAINTVPWVDIFGLRRTSPIRKRCNRDGGVSGALIKEHGRSTVRILRQQLDWAGKKDFPIIGLGGIFTPGDARNYLYDGATHIAMGTALTWPIYWLQALATIRWLGKNQNTSCG